MLKFKSQTDTGILQKIAEKILKKEYATYTDYSRLLEAINSYQELTNKQYYRSYSYASINARAEKLSTADLLIYKKRGKELVEVEDSDLAKWFFKSSNAAEQSFSDLLKLITQNLDLSGHCLLKIIRGLNSIPIEFQFVPGSKITQTYRNEYNAIAKIDYSDGIYQKSVSYGEFLYFYLPNPENPLSHLSTVSACRESIDIDYFQSKYNSNFYKNNARIDGILTTEQDISSKIDELRKMIKANYVGDKNAGKLMILHSGFKYEPTGATAKEMDFVESRKAVRDEIFSIFRVPKTILGIADDVNRANAVTALINFMQNTIIPFSKPIESKFNQFVKKSFGKEYELKFDYSLEEDPAVRTQTNKLLIDSGAITLNELRDAYNYDTSTDPICDEHIIRNLPKEEVPNTESKPKDDGTDT